MIGEYDSGYESCIDTMVRQMEGMQYRIDLMVHDNAALRAKNEKLRELCATVIDDWMSKVCPSFPFCECGGEYQDCTDEACGNQIYRQIARELGVEVE